jgi:hypothetical protein
MKVSGKMLGVLVVAASFVASQSVWAKQDLDCDVQVSGDICTINYDVNSIDVSADCSNPEIKPTTVFGIPLDYLEKWQVLDVEPGLAVDINAHECPTSGKLMACDLTYTNDLGESITIDLRQGSLGENQVNQP